MLHDVKIDIPWLMKESASQFPNHSFQWRPRPFKMHARITLGIWESMNLRNAAGIKRSCIRVMEVRNIQDHQNRWNLFSDRMSHHSMLKITTSHSQHLNHCWENQQVASLLTGFKQNKYKKKHAMHLTKGAAGFSICTTRPKFKGDTNFGSMRITQIYQW